METMYEELVSQIRGCVDCACGECKYEHLQKPDNFVRCMNTLVEEAADAIEKLIRAHEADRKEIEWLKKCLHDMPETPKEG